MMCFISDELASATRRVARHGRRAKSRIAATSTSHRPASDVTGTATSGGNRSRTRADHESHFGQFVAIVSGSVANKLGTTASKTEGMLRTAKDPALSTAA